MIRAFAIAHPLLFALLVVLAILGLGFGAEWFGNRGEYEPK